MKTCEQIYQEMLRIFREKTGFQMEDSADLAVRLYAAAAQLESLYAYCGWSLDQSFPQTAAGEFLDRHGALRGLKRREGARAAGFLRFSVGEARTNPVDVPAGTVCTTAGLVRFVTTEDAVIPAGSLYVNVPARAEAVGSAGNAGPGSIVYLTQAPAGVTACTNPETFSGGQAPEDDETFRFRLLADYARLPNGANKAFYEARALSHRDVGGVFVQPRAHGIGTVSVTVAARDGLPSEALLREIRADLNASREIAVDVEVKAPTVSTVDISADLTPRAGIPFEEARAAAEAALRGFFTGALLGKPIYRAQLGDLIFRTGLVQNYHLTAPSADLKAADGVLPQLGRLTLTEGI